MDDAFFPNLCIECAVFLFHRDCRSIPRRRPSSRDRGSTLCTSINPSRCSSNPCRCPTIRHFGSNCPMAQDLCEGGDHHWRPTAFIQWHIGLVARRACVAAFDLVRLPCFDWPDGLKPVAHSLALALTLALALRETNLFRRQDTLYTNVFV